VVGRYRLVVNLHLALAVSTCPFVEFPLTRGLTAERRDWASGRRDRLGRTIAPPDSLGSASPDFDALSKRWRVA
jgi:hypothetical protein